MTICPRDVREIQTLEIRQPGSPYSTNTLDVAICVDGNTSVTTILGYLSTALPVIETKMDDTYARIRFALIVFRDEDDTEITTGSKFVREGKIRNDLAEIEPASSVDTPQNGYGAICLACADLAWGASPGGARAVFLISDVASHTRGATLADAADALADLDATFFYGPFDGADYNTLVTATGGAKITPTDFTNATTLRSRLVTLWEALSVDTGLDPIYLVNDNVPFTAFLEPVGDADPVEIEFQTRSFAINTADSGEDGVKGVSITIDNTDLAVSQYLSEAAKKTAPVEVTLRVYLSDDLSGPQNDPPITLYLGPIETRGTVVSGEARWIDIQNAPFPNIYYNRANFPGL